MRGSVSLKGLPDGYGNVERVKIIKRVKINLLNIKQLC